MNTFTFVLKTVKADIQGTLYVRRCGLFFQGFQFLNAALIYQKNKIAPLKKNLKPPLQPPL